jgi:hypothetical protein
VLVLVRILMSKSGCTMYRSTLPKMLVGKMDSGAKHNTPHPVHSLFNPTQREKDLERV